MTSKRKKVGTTKPNGTILSPISSSTNPENPIFKKAFGLSLLLMLGIFFIAGYDTGVCYDELTQNVYGKANISYYASGGKDTSFLHLQFSDRDGAGTLHSTIKYYTSVFEYLGVGFNMVTGNIDGYEYNRRHAINQVIAVIGLFFTGLIARRISGNFRSALIAVWLLFLTPLFFGMSLFNTKEIPFLTGYVGSLYFSIIFFESLPKPSWKSALGIMISLFFAMGIRLGGIMLIFYIALFGILYWVTNKEYRTTFHNYIQNWGLKIGIAIVGALVLTVLFCPFLLLSPINNFIAALNVTTKFPQRIPVLFDGTLTNSLELPSGYLPKMMSMTIPALVLIGLVVSCIIILVQWKSTNMKIILLLIFSSFFPVFYAEYTHASMYNSWRHFLFVYPGIVIIVATGIEYILNLLNKNKHRIGFILFLVLGMLSPILWLMRTTPYQYTYFNEFAGGFKNVFHDYEKDYWFISVKESIDWLVKQERLEQAKDTITLGTNSVAFAHYYFKRRYPNLKVKTVEMGFRGRNTVNWDYAVLGNFFINPELEERNFPPLKTIHTVDIDGMPVSAIIKDLNRYDIKAMKALATNNFPLSDSLYDIYLNEIGYKPGVPIDMGGIAGFIAYAKLGNNKGPEAKTFAGNALLFDRADYMGNTIMGICLLREGNKVGARKHLEIAKSVNPKDQLATRFLAQIR